MSSWISGDRRRRRVVLACAHETATSITRVPGVETLVGVLLFRRAGRRASLKSDAVATAHQGRQQSCRSQSLRPRVRRVNSFCQAHLQKRKRPRRHRTQNRHPSARSKIAQPSRIVLPQLPSPPKSQGACRQKSPRKTENAHFKFRRFSSVLQNSSSPKSDVGNVPAGTLRHRMRTAKP